MNKINFPIKITSSAPVLTILSLLIVIIMGTVILWPKYQELKGSEKIIGEKKAELQFKEEYFSKLNETKTKLKEYEEELSKINSAIPDYLSLPSLFNFIQKASSQSGLVLGGIGSAVTSPSNDVSGLQETAFSLEFLGSYSSLKNFLSTLEKSARIIEVENISLSAAESNLGLAKEKESFSFNLKLKTYSY